MQGAKQRNNKIILEEILPKAGLQEPHASNVLEIPFFSIGDGLFAFWAEHKKHPQEKANSSRLFSAVYSEAGNLSEVLCKPKITDSIKLLKNPGRDNVADKYFPVSKVVRIF